MYLTGLAGGGFMLVRDKKGRFEFIDYRETAPASSTEEMFNNDTTASLFGGLASYADKHHTSSSLHLPTLTRRIAEYQGKFEASNIFTPSTDRSHGPTSSIHRSRSPGKASWWARTW